MFKRITVIFNYYHATKNLSTMIILGAFYDSMLIPRYLNNVYSNLKRKLRGRPMFGGLLEDSVILWRLRSEFQQTVACMAATNASVSSSVFQGIVKQWGLVGKEEAVPSRHRTILSELTGRILSWRVEISSVNESGTKLKMSETRGYWIGPVYQFKRPSARLSASPVHSNDFFGMIGRVGLPQHVPLSLSSANQAIYSVSGEDAAVGPYLLCYESMGGSTASPIRLVCNLEAAFTRDSNKTSRPLHILPSSSTFIIIITKAPIHSHHQAKPSLKLPLAKKTTPSKDPPRLHKTPPGRNTFASRAARGSWQPTVSIGTDPHSTWLLNPFVPLSKNKSFFDQLIMRLTLIACEGCRSDFGMMGKVKCIAYNIQNQRNCEFVPTASSDIF
ncbi:hypothetical protein VP01_269g2 [Puccinia sorghi]|uniref:Uncharacterized protein n=1 Tax=Puccinia sorghi TaxID=27349 RepID=A0A0L6V4F0_9BASI|nr:hypothetical protein VP01_269g2 [Puccinia sorghi]